MKDMFEVFLALGLLFGFQAPAVGDGQVPRDAIRVESALVNVPVVVSDAQGRTVTGLQQGDFALFQDGFRQRIDLFIAAEEPINVALLLDTSKSTATVLKKIRKAAEDFLNELGRGDRAMVVSFDADIHILCRLSGDKRKLRDAVRSAEVGEYVGTRMRDAILTVAQKHLGAIQGRKAIVLLSDGQDYGSRTSPGDLISDVAESGTVVYSIFYTVDPRELAKKLFGISLPERRDRSVADPRLAGVSEDWREREQAAAEFVQSLSGETAGRFYRSQVEDLKRTFVGIATELRHQYLLGFYPEKAMLDGKPHRLKVTLDRPGLAVRSRQSYRSAPE